MRLAKGRVEGKSLPVAKKRPQRCKVRERATRLSAHEAPSSHFAIATPMWGKGELSMGLRPRADKICGPSFRKPTLVTTRSKAVKDVATRSWVLIYRVRL